MPGTLFVVATPIGNLEDVSARALRVLKEVAVIAAEDTRRTAHLLARYAIATPTTSLHEHNETAKAAALVARLLSGDSVALVSDAGTPTISDPGAQLVNAALESDIRVEPIPGPSAALSILAVAGLPADRFSFFGFPPIKAKDRNDWFNDLISAGHPVVFFESPHRIIATLTQLRTITGESRVVVGRELTKAHEEVIRGTISQVIEKIGLPRGEFVIVTEGRSTSRPSDEVAEPSDQRIAEEFGLITEKKSMSRRRAISEVSRRLGLPPNRVYEAVERHKKSGI